MLNERASLSLRMKFLFNSKIRYFCEVDDANKVAKMWYLENDGNLGKIWLSKKVPDVKNNLRFFLTMGRFCLIFDSRSG